MCFFYLSVDRRFFFKLEEWELKKDMPNNETWEIAKKLKHDININLDAVILHIIRKQSLMRQKYSSDFIMRF